MANLLLAVAIMVGAFVWYRSGFRQPRLWPLPQVPPQKAVVFAGVAIIAVTGLLCFGDVVGGYTSLNLSQAHHVHRSMDPGAFWGQILLQVVVGVATGGVLVACGRASARGGRGVPLSE